MSAENFSVVMTRISKRFGPNEALRNVDYSASPGCINAIIGENGAGKSTLVKILFGLLPPDSGTVEVSGQAIPSGYNTRNAINLGIGMLQQHISLIPAFTALENIVLGCETRAGLKLDLDAARERVLSILGELGGEIDLNSPASRLSVSARQLIEITRMLFTGARIMIFDEPTATLAPHEIERFYRLTKQLAGEGRTIILITHRLAEVLKYADNATVLRRGLVTALFERGQINEEDLISAIVPAAKAERAFQLAPFSSDGGPVLDLENVSCVDDAGKLKLTDISLQIRAGEILGIAGVTGSGQIELAESVVGLRPAAEGIVRFKGIVINQFDTARRRRLGLVYIPEDRFAHGVIPPFTLTLNRLLGDHRSHFYRKLGSYDTHKLREDVRDKIARYLIDAEGPDIPLAVLSGGNQQKLMLARELDRSPQLIVAHGPTRGLDVISTRRCYQKLLELAAGGAAVLLFSAELGDLLSYTHRIAVLFGGHLIEAGSSEGLNARQVGLLMIRGQAA